MKREFIAGIGLLFGVMACGATPDENTGATSEAYGEAACGSTSSADVTLSGYVLGDRSRAADYQTGSSPNATYGQTSCANAYIADQPITGTSGDGSIQAGVSYSLGQGISQADCPHYCTRWKAYAYGVGPPPFHQSVFQGLTPTGGDTSQVAQGHWGGIGAGSCQLPNDYSTYKPTVASPTKVRLEAQAFYSNDTTCGSPAYILPLNYLVGQKGVPR